VTSMIVPSPQERARRLRDRGVFNLPTITGNPAVADSPSGKAISLPEPLTPREARVVPEDRPSESPSEIPVVPVPPKDAETQREREPGEQPGQPKPEEAKPGEANPTEETPKKQVLAPPRAKHPDGEARRFDDFKSEWISLEHLSQYLAQVKGQTSRVYGENHRGTINGVTRLKWIWREDTVLRASLLTPKKFQIHFWNGTEGVTLTRFPSRIWAAYRVSRRDAKRPIPDARTLAATDDGRFARGNEGTFEVRWQDGELIFRRGGLRLLSAPMKNIPKAVYLDGHASFRGIALLKAPPEVQVPKRPARYYLRSEDPALLSWKPHLPDGSQLNARMDGTVELHGKSAKEDAWAALSLDQTGLREIVFHIQRAESGCGFFLSGPGNKPLCTVRYYDDPRVKALMVAHAGPGAAT
ncbi:MAG: hypothetical protein N2C14_07640, partial [Planctomycetales bacterium]